MCAEGVIHSLTSSMRFVLYCLIVRLTWLPGLQCVEQNQKMEERLHGFIHHVSWHEVDMGEGPIFK